MKNYIIFSIMAMFTFVSCKKQEILKAEKRNMPTALVRVKQHLTEISKTTGTTTSIVLIGGFGSELLTWQKLYATLPANYTVFTYNRAGIGASENVPGIRDANSIANEMLAVLEANQIKPPYIFVAHSMGGIYARMFYHMQPSKVKGIVLVDATHEHQLDSLLGMIPPTDRDMVLAEMFAANEAALNSMPSGSLKEEFRSNFATNYQQIKQYPAITNIPLYVITSTKVSPENPPFVVDVHKALHEQWALRAGSNGKFKATSNSGHYIQVEEPNLVAEGISWVLSK